MKSEATAGSPVPTKEVGVGSRLGMSGKRPFYSLPARPPRLAWRAGRRQSLRSCPTPARRPGQAFRFTSSVASLVSDFRLKPGSQRAFPRTSKVQNNLTIQQSNNLTIQQSNQPFGHSYPFGQLLHRFPFLNFLQHFFFFLASTMGRGKGRRRALGSVSILFFLACIFLASLRGTWSLLSLINLNK